jgi:large subunit ribosomal protein L22
MVKFGYSIVGLDPDKTAKASGRDMDISHKHAREICNVVNGMLIDEAKTYLQKVIDKKTAVPFRRHHKKIGHRSELVGWDVGRYPVKASQKILEIINNAESNAEYKGLEVDRLMIIHAAAHKGRVNKRIFYRAFRTSSPKNNTLTHVEIAVEEI